jgi:hypothetical protein
MNLTTKRCTPRLHMHTPTPPEVDPEAPPPPTIDPDPDPPPEDDPSNDPARAPDGDPPAKPPPVSAACSGPRTRRFFRSARVVALDTRQTS